MWRRVPWKSTDPRPIRKRVPKRYLNRGSLTPGKKWYATAAAAKHAAFEIVFQNLFHPEQTSVRKNGMSGTRMNILNEIIHSLEGDKNDKRKKGYATRLCRRRQRSCSRTSRQTRCWGTSIRAGQMLLSCLLRSLSAPSFFLFFVRSRVEGLTVGKGRRKEGRSRRKVSSVVGSICNAREGCGEGWGNCFSFYTSRAGDQC